MHAEGIELPPAFLRAFTLLVVVAMGGIRELFELGIGTVATWMNADPPLVVLGLDDAILDVVFNAIGGVIIAVVGPGYLSELPSTLAGRVMDRR